LSSRAIISVTPTLIPAKKVEKFMYNVGPLNKLATLKDGITSQCENNTYKMSLVIVTSGENISMAVISGYFFEDKLVPCLQSMAASTVGMH